MTDAEKYRAMRDADPWDTGKTPSFNAFDAVGVIAAVILLWMTLAGLFGWPPFGN